MNPWIDPYLELPEDGIHVLVRMEDDAIWIAFHDGHIGWMHAREGDAMRGTITGWMHLPEP